MKLADIIKNTDCKIIQDTDKEILSVVYDSRKVTEGSVFVAVSGETTDGARYVGDAVRGGAVAVVSEKSVPVPEGIGCVMADDTRFALGAIAKNFYGNPSSFMKLTGITGTSGKTTVSN
ncbi:MAG: UDP-N-acetylmuramoyl-L-alanyl-D-glutamate--2,6-diaminopimelate ligase, partial [Armatimonadetes bacterium]|nr:UDP-N-acetylmuramoyl-L-alanyl-D-glutamate--2,6-diaminopimelate ligase [Candidatus Hippobium faecium]